MSWATQAREFLESQIVPILQRALTEMCIQVGLVEGWVVVFIFPLG